MVSIRLSRGGARKYPFYHVVVTDSRHRRDGRYLERLGFFRPNAVPGEETLRVDVARAEYWIGQGARPSERVTKLLDDIRKGKATRAAAKSEAAKPEAAKPRSAKSEAAGPEAPETAKPEAESAQDSESTEAST